MSLFELALERVLDATTHRDFERCLYEHGPVRFDELDLLGERACSSDPIVRRNAALLLSIARCTDARDSLLAGLARTTTDTRVFILAVDAYGDADLARDPRVDDALASDDAKVRDAARRLRPS
jgi:hypothetical protein